MHRSPTKHTHPVLRQIARAGDFQGRSGAGETGAYLAAWGLVTVTVAVAAACCVSWGAPTAAGVLAACAPAAVGAVPVPALAVRRLRDAGLHPSLAALLLLPVVGWGPLVLLMTLPGQPTAPAEVRQGR